MSMETSSSNIETNNNHKTINIDDPESFKILSQRIPEISKKYDDDQELPTKNDLGIITTIKKMLNDKNCGMSLSYSKEFFTPLPGG